MNEHSTPRPVHTRWHPRVTPFRLTFVLSTTTLGIAKAVLVSQGNNIGSTTLEWVAGVVLALRQGYTIFNIFKSLQFLGDLEASDYHSNLADYSSRKTVLGPFGGFVSLHESESPTGEVALVTPYRLSVSAVTLAFGAAKIACTCIGLSGAMSTLDWAFSVPIALLPYCVGLYEDNTVHLASQFFETDCSNALRDVTTGWIYLTLVLLSLLWFHFWFIYLPTAPRTLESVTANFSRPAPGFPSNGTICTLLCWILGIHELSIQISFAFVGIFIVSTGCVPLEVVYMNGSSWPPARKAGRRIKTGIQHFLEWSGITTIAGVSYRLQPLLNVAFYTSCLFLALFSYAGVFALCILCIGTIFEGLGITRQRVLRWAC